MAVNLLVSHRRQVPLDLKGVIVRQYLLVQGLQQVDFGATAEDADVVTGLHHFVEFLDFLLGLYVVGGFGGGEGLEVLVELLSGVVLEELLLIFHPGFASLGGHLVLEGYVISVGFLALLLEHLKQFL